MQSTYPTKSLLKGVQAAVVLLSCASPLSAATVSVCAAEFPNGGCSPLVTGVTSIRLFGPLPERIEIHGELSSTMFSKDFPNVSPGSYRVEVSGCTIGGCFEDRDIAVADHDVLVVARPRPIPTPLPTTPPAACPGDSNGDGAVTVDEILVTVSVALTGCPAQ